MTNRALSLWSEALVIADISGLTPAERMELEAAVESRFGSEITFSDGTLLSVLTDKDSRPRVTRFIQGFGGLVEGADLGVAMIESGVPATDAVRYLVELPAPEHVGIDPQETCPEGFYWDKAIAECRPALGSD